METLCVTSFERDTILAALRYWQRNVVARDGVHIGDVPEGEIATDNGDYLGEHDIDTLCERINCN